MSDVQTFKVKIRGIRPLLMHSGRLADPLDPATQRLAELTKMKQKDHDRISRAEFEGGLYVADGKVVVPGEVVDACLRDGAKAMRKGKAIVAGVSVVEGACQLEHPGPSDWQKLYDLEDANGRKQFVDRRGVKIQKNRVIRTRARFNEWALTFSIERYDFAEVTAKEIQQALEHAGVAVGLLNFRPKFGLFLVEEFKLVA